MHRTLDLFVKITCIKKHKKKTAYYFANIPSKALSYITYGGDEGDRTPDLLNAIQALSQLSYAPMHN